MVWREMPQAAAISEFVAGYTGDCGETAELCALHVAQGMPLDVTQLRELTQRAIAQRHADATGSEPLAAIATDLAFVGAQYENAGFSQPPGFDWLGTLRQLAGVKPIILEFANAQALPGDESGVHYHFATALAGDPSLDRYGFADGDNVAARSGALVTYTAGQLAEAQVCGMIVVESSAGAGIGGGHMVVPQGWSDDGQQLTAPNAVVVVRGFRDYILTHGWLAEDWPLAPEAGADPVEPGNPGLGAGTCQIFRLTKLSWTQSRGVYVTWIGQDYQALAQQLAAAQATATQLQAQITQLQALITQLQAAEGDSKNTQAILALKAALGLQ